MRGCARTPWVALRSILSLYFKCCWTTTTPRTPCPWGQVHEVRRRKKQSPFDVFAEFYRRQNGTDLTEEQAAFLRSQMESVWEEEV